MLRYQLLHLLSVCQLSVLRINFKAKPTVYAVSIPIAQWICVGMVVRAVSMIAAAHPSLQIALEIFAGMAVHVTLTAAALRKNSAVILVMRAMCSI